MKKIIILGSLCLGLVACQTSGQSSPTPSAGQSTGPLSQYEGSTNRGGSWVKSGSNLIFQGDRLNGTVLRPNMGISVKLDGQSISGCSTQKSRSNPKGIRIYCTGAAPNSALNDKPDGLGVATN